MNKNARGISSTPLISYLLSHPLFLRGISCVSSQWYQDRMREWENRNYLLYARNL